MILLCACSSEPTTTPDEPAVYDPTPYVFDPMGLPMPALPADNPLTVQKVKLGEMLFNEKMLSKDGSQSCASCHVKADAFSDIRRFSIGVEGLPGKRQAMPVFNMAWHRNGFFWDGRAPKLRDQSLRPIQDPLEMNETLTNAVAKLQSSKTYRDQFIRAFNTDTVTSEKMSLAMEAFMLTLVSANAKWDNVLKGTATFTTEEARGRDLFFRERQGLNDPVGAECFHCHGGPNFTNDRYINNGLDAEPDFTDLGRFDVSGYPEDKARFLTPSLRNIALTPPYMHDGRFATLEECIEHYDSGVKQSSTVDDALHFNLRPGGLGLSAQDKADLVAFLKALTDTSFTR